MADSDNFLTDQIIRSATSREKPYTIRDGRGLFLLVHPNGSKYFQLRVTVAGVRKLIQIGVYPKISIHEARKLARAKVDSLENDSDVIVNSIAKKALASYPKASNEVSTESPIPFSVQASVNEMNEEGKEIYHQQYMTDELPYHKSQDLFTTNEIEINNKISNNSIDYKNSEQAHLETNSYHHEDKKQHFGNSLVKHDSDANVYEADQNMIDSSQHDVELLSSEDLLIEAVNLRNPKKVPQVNLTFEQIVYWPNQRTEILGFFGKLNRMITNKLHQRRKVLLKTLSEIRYQLNQSRRVFFGGVFEILDRLKQFVTVRIYMNFIRKIINKLLGLLMKIKLFFGIKLNQLICLVKKIIKDGAHVLFNFPFKITLQWFLLRNRQLFLGLQTQFLKLLNHFIKPVAWFEQFVIVHLKTIQHKVNVKKSTMTYFLKSSVALNVAANQSLSRSRMNHALEFRGNYVKAIVLFFLVAIAK